MSQSNDFRFDADFYKSNDGVFKVIQMILVLLLFIFVLASSFWEFQADFVGAAVFFAAFSLFTLIISVVIYSFRLYNGFFLDRLPWRMTEIAFAGGNIIMHFIVMVVAAVAAQHEPNNVLFAASAVLSVCVMISFGLYIFVLWKGSKLRSEDRL